ncbi:uncharacterized protein MELLADRAFT_76559 [Melampsora larici-populina 98AG31]|uniref:Uncharacterized protein n=1 Tax=Melampsora larici-populina (strain 98AG31 / pathotype 3-4-7) TaxID=747676 RepID=F4R5L9_MELLP|nr:uncharacterized protein MELLADRAFT_76559 [Melampsora larici-populina 98AG31]EGG12239.1 hypothetical protein MELLADRAFT_76559 [Melampsora larici-populina 98AG31]
MNLSSNSIIKSDLGPLLEDLHLGPNANHPLIRNGHVPFKEHKPEPSNILLGNQEQTTLVSSKPVNVSLPDELIEAILEFVFAFGVEDATRTLKSCKLVSPQLQRIIIPRLDASPMIDMGSRRAALDFLSRVSDELVDHQLDLMNFKPNKSPPPDSLIGRMRKLMFIGEAVWRHRSSTKDRHEFVDRQIFHEILNRIWSTRIHTLVFVELPYTNPFFRTVVNRYPSTLTTVIMLTPLSPFQLLFFLRELPSLRQLCIGSRDDSPGDPAEHHTLFSRDQLPSSKLISFGIAARASERWLKTGLPWLENILNLIVVPCVLTIKTLHLELADDGDQRHLLNIFFPPVPTAQPPLNDLPGDPSSSDSSSRSSPTQLRTLYLRGISSSLMSQTLPQCKGIKRLCLSSIYGTALRSSKYSLDFQILPADASSEPAEEVSSPSEYEPPPLGLLRSSHGPADNPVWTSIPDSLEELSIDVTRLSGHGPWNARSAGKLAGTLAELLVSNQCPKLIRLGSFFANEDFVYGIHALRHGRKLIPEVQHLIQLAEAKGVCLVASLWSESFVPSAGGNGWYGS